MENQESTAKNGEMDSESVTFEGLNCERCHLELDEGYVCTLVECQKILCSICCETHDHASAVVNADKAMDTIKPFIGKYRRSIKECVTKAMSQRAKSENEALTRLNRSAEVKRQISDWCSRMHKVIDQAESSLLQTVEAMEEEFRTESSTLIKELKILERDYRNVNDLKTAYNANKLSNEQAFKLYALMKKYEENLSDPNKTNIRKYWEQTYLSFIPNEDALASLKTTAYVCGKIKSNIQLSIVTDEDKSTCGSGGMALIGGRLAVSDKYNHSIKIFSRPLNCGLGGEPVETKLLSFCERDEVKHHFNSPGDLAYDVDKNLLIVTNEQDNCVMAVDPDTAQLHWQLDVKRPNGVALSNKHVVVCSEYEKHIMTFKRSNMKKADSVLLKDHPLSIAANRKGVIAICTIYGRMAVMNSDLKEQHVLDREIDGELFRPQRVCSMYNDRFLACDTQRVLEIEPNCIVRRTILVAGMPGTSIPELPAALACDQHRNIFMAFLKYVKVFPVPLELIPPSDDYDTTSSYSATNSEGGPSSDDKPML